MITPSFGLTATERVLPKMALDFTTASLDPRVTFTRSGNTATVINSSGLVVPINANLPRFDYNPTTLVCQGLLIEESRTNSITVSNTFSAWSSVNTTVTSAASTSPDGTVNGWNIENTSTFSFVAFGSTLAPGAGSATISIWLKANSSSVVSLGMNDGGWGTTANATIISGPGSVTQIAGSLFSVSGLSSSTWTRVAISRTGFIATITYYVYPGPWGGQASGQSVYVYGAQLEAGDFPTSYIPTTVSQVTRTADDATMTGTNFSDWYSTSQGTFVGQAIAKNLASYAPLEVSNGSFDKRLFLGVTGTTFRTYFQLPITSLTTSVTNAVVGVVNKQSAGYSSAGVLTAANGVAASSTATAWADQANVNTLRIGASFNAPGNNWVQKIAYYPLRLTSAEIQAITK